ncbi:ankyrin repeat domain-containing protein [Pseudomonas sp. CF161]|uniref:ankyrin repeat domain-containing protein n=1 Tax=Pseudomonas sp. CF161 TaxID=911241 RepID=UPI0003550623|nr:ankyrin repeat domain-containing protein [Pseudomonas sp. CF161]EPL07189.1 hypothetical protein CF161_18314 [Pseudomonas sp. CF161]
MMDEVLIVDLFEAGDALVNGDTGAMERLLPRLKRSESYNDLPMLFYVADSIECLEFLAANKVDLFQRSHLGGGNLLHRVALEHDDSVFEWVLAWYRKHNSVDQADDHGITVLSMLLKFGHIERVKRLIDNGASLSSAARNGLTPARQAVICMGQERDAMAGLELILSHGLILGSEELEYLAQTARAINRPTLARWIEEDLLPAAALQLRK